MSTNEDKLRGGIAFITGAGAGIGAGLARRAGLLGMTVIVADIAADAAERVAAEIREAGGQVETMVVDVGKPAQLDAAAEQVFARHGEVRVLVNNAGIETMGFAWEIPADRWEQTLNVNVHGVVHGVRAFVPRMLASGRECWIANLSSVGGFSVMPTQTAYIMTKHAVQAFTECLYLEMKEKRANVHVCSVIPGMLRTDIFQARNSAGEPEAAARLRATMRDTMAAYGMDLDEGCRKIMDGIVAGRFWCDTQPDMTEQSVAGRIQFMQHRKDPELAESARGLLG